METPALEPVVIEPLPLEQEVLWSLRFGPLDVDAVIEFLDGYQSDLSVQDCLWDLVKTGRARFHEDNTYTLIGD